MPVPTLSPADRALLGLLANRLFGGDAPPSLGDAAPVDVLNRARIHTVAAIAFDALPPAVAAENGDVYRKWQRLALSIVTRSMRVDAAGAALCRLLTAHGIPHCTIKGAVSAYYYPDPILRQNGDVDMLVSPDDVDKTRRVMEQDGFVYQYEHDFHVGYAKGGVLFELHTQVTRLPEDKAHLLRYLDGALDEARPIETPGGTVIGLGARHHAITMLLHMHRHMVDGSGIGLRHLADWAVFAAAFSEEEWQAQFADTIRAMGLWTFATVISKAAAMYLSMPPKAWFADADDELATAIIADMLHSGNFGGAHAVERAQQLMFRTEKYAGKSAWTRFWLSVRDRVYQWSPFYQTHKWLFPIGLVAYAARIGWQMLFARKKIHLGSLYKHAKEQQGIYERLNIFEN